jgi:hypothetical protein
MGEKTGCTALANTWRRRQALCVRCLAPWAFEERHVCDDLVRHPNTVVLLEGLRTTLEGVEAHRANLIAQALRESGTVVLEQMSETELEMVFSAARAARAYQTLPDPERGVAQAILEHAGVDMDLGRMTLVV